MSWWQWRFPVKEKRASETIPVLKPENCMHLKWLPETKENGWREVCSACGQKAYGSCQ